MPQDKFTRGICDINKGNYKSTEREKKALIIWGKNAIFLSGEIKSKMLILPNFIGFKTFETEIIVGLSVYTIFKMIMKFMIEKLKQKNKRGYYPIK